MKKNEKPRVFGYMRVATAEQLKEQPPKHKAKVRKEKKWQEK